MTDRPATLVAKLARGHGLSPDEYAALIDARTPALADELAGVAHHAGQPLVSRRRIFPALQHEGAEARLPPFLGAGQNLLAGKAVALAGAGAVPDAAGEPRHCEAVRRLDRRAAVAYGPRVAAHRSGKLEDLAPLRKKEDVRELDEPAREHAIPVDGLAHLSGATGQLVGQRRGAGINERGGLVAPLFL